MPIETETRLIDSVCTGDEVTVDLDNLSLTNHSTGEVTRLKPLGDVAPILEAGGVFAYARQAGMLG